MMEGKLNASEIDEDSITVVSVLEGIVELMCSRYCKWPDLWDEEKEGIELCESDICKDCPLSRLV